MVKQGDLVAIFQSIHRVMKAEKVLKGVQADILLIPVPRQLSSDCGLALRIAPEEHQRVLALLAEAGLPLLELYVCQGDGFNPLPVS